MSKKIIRIDKILSDGQIHIREELSGTYHRYVLNPGMEITGHSIEIKNTCSRIWTNDIKQAWSDSIKV